MPGVSRQRLPSTKNYSDTHCSFALPPLPLPGSQPYTVQYHHLNIIQQTYVTVNGKTWHTGFLVKIEFDVSLISSTLELTHL